MLNISKHTRNILLLCLFSNVSLADAPGEDSDLSTVDAVVESKEAAMPVPANTPIPELAGFKAEYEIGYLAFNADLNLHLQSTNDAGEYQYEVVTKARGLAKLVRSGTGVESSVFTLTADGFRPQSYHLDDGTEKLENDADIEFDWENNIARSVYVGEPKEIPLHPGVVDRLTSDIAAIHALRNGEEPGSYEITDGESIRVYEFSPQGQDTVTVPAGTFQAVKYLRQRPGSSRAAMIWYAVDAAYLPVKIEHLKRGKTNITMVATRLQPGDN